GGKIFPPLLAVVLTVESPDGRESSVVASAARIFANGGEKVLGSLRVNVQQQNFELRLFLANGVCLYSATMDQFVGYATG
ncbi:hypothetical protein, partial [Afipia sp. NBIMC_P1-C2]